MMKSPVMILLVSLLVIVGVSTAFGQDTGTPDTCRFDPTAPVWNVDTEGDTLFTIELWGWTDQVILATSLGFEIRTSTGGGTGHDDSLIIIDTFTTTVSPAPNIVTIAFSVLNEGSFPPASHEGFNGCLIGLVNLFTPLIPVNTPVKLGDMRLRLLDPTQLPCSFDIIIDSTFYPPAGPFKYSPQTGSGYPPEFFGSTITVVNNLCAPPADPEIGLDPDTSFYFEAVAGETDPDVQVLNVSNIGEGTLNWTATNLQPWLTLSPSSGVDDGPCSLYVSIAGLSAGSYEDTITVSDPAATNDPQKVPVYLTVLPPPPVIVLDPDSLTFEAVEGGPNPADQVLSITNAVESTLEWTATDDALWLTLNPTSGTGDGATTLSVNIAGLAAGVYSASVTVTDPNAVNSPQVARVALYIAEPPPEIVLTPNGFFFEAPEGGPNPLGQIMMITNDGGGTLDWTATDDADWLNLVPASGVGDAPCTLFVDVTGLAVGSYDAVVTVSDPAAINDPQTVDVNLIITDTTSTELATIIEPNPQYVYFKFAIDPMMATIYVGNFGEDCGASDVIESSILINDSIPALSTEILTSYPGFDGEVLAITIPIAPFLDGYGILFDTTISPYTVIADCETEASIEVEGEVTLIGKSSQIPERWIAPPDLAIVPGDADLSGYVDIDDVMALIGYIFGGQSLPGSIVRGDTDCSHSVDLDDVIVIIDYMYGGGPSPCAQ